MSKNNPFKEYSNDLSLQNILEELSLYCMHNMIDANGIRIILPKKVIEKHSLSFKPVEKIVVGSVEEKDPVIKTQHFAGGIIHLHSLEENEEIIKGLV